MLFIYSLFVYMVYMHVHWVSVIILLALRCSRLYWSCYYSTPQATFQLSLLSRWSYRCTFWFIFVLWETIMPISDLRDIWELSEAIHEKQFLFWNLFLFVWGFPFLWFTGFLKQATHELLILLLRSPKELRLQTTFISS